MADYIEKQSLIKFFDNLRQPKMPISEGFKFVTVDSIIEFLLNQPTADVAPVMHSEWIVQIDCEGKTRSCKCKRCGYTTGPFTWDNPNFCARCGAKMDKE